MSAYPFSTEPLYSTYRVLMNRETGRFSFHSETSKPQTPPQNNQIITSTDSFLDQIKKGGMDAHFELANLYQKGSQIVEKDLTSAKRLYSLLADRGHVQAMFELANLYLEPKNNDCANQRNEHADQREAVHYLKEAAKTHKGAMLKLAECYKKGIGTYYPDNDQAEYYSNRAKSSSSEISSYNIGIKIGNGIQHQSSDNIMAAVKYDQEYGVRQAWQLSDKTQGSVQNNKRQATLDRILAEKAKRTPISRNPTQPTVVTTAPTIVATTAPTPIIAEAENLIERKPTPQRAIIQNGGLVPAPGGPLILDDKNEASDHDASAEVPLTFMAPKKNFVTTAAVPTESLTRPKAS